MSQTLQTPPPEAPPGQDLKHLRRQTRRAGLFEPELVLPLLCDVCHLICSYATLSIGCERRGVTHRKASREPVTTVVP